MSGPPRQSRVRRAAVLCCVWVGLLYRPALALAQAAPPTPIKVGRLTISGYVQADYRTAIADEPDAVIEGFLLRRARLSFITEIAPTITLVAQGDFAASPIARDIYIQFSGMKYAAIRAGQFVAPFGLERMTSSYRLELIDRSVVAEVLTPSRDVGVMVSNPRPFWNWLTYYAAVVNGSGQNNRDANKAKDLVGRLAAAIPPVKGLSIGVNANGGTQPDGVRRRYGADISYERPCFRATAERIEQTLDGPVDRTLSGLVLIGVWRQPAAKRTDYFAGYELAARFVNLDDGAGAIGAAPIGLRELQFGGNYYITPQARVMSNLVVPIGDEQPITRTRWWTRLQVVF